MPTQTLNSKESVKIMVQSVLDAKSKKQFNSISAYEEALTNFTVSEPKEEIRDQNGFTKSSIPLVDEYFELVAVAGRPYLPWNVIRPAFLWKLQSVINDMHMNEAMLENDDAVKEEIIKRESILQSRKFILDKAKAFDGTPFTIQRLCELITTPTRHYHSTEKFLHALEKNINVVTTVDENGDRITGGDDFVPEERDSPVPVERNFIVSVDELDDPLPLKVNGEVKKENVAKKEECDADNEEAMSSTYDASSSQPTSTGDVEESGGDAVDSQTVDDSGDYSVGGSGNSVEERSNNTTSDVEKMHVDEDAGEKRKRDDNGKPKVEELEQ